MVLIISTSKRKAQIISEIFYYMGIPSYASTPAEAFSEFSVLYRAAVVLEPQELPDTESFISRLRSYASKIPIFAISDSDTYDKALFEDTFESSVYSSTLVERIVEYQHNRRLPLTAYYRLAGIDASCVNKHVTYFDRSLDFTKTEVMILRYLITSYPTPQSARNIIKYAYKHSKKPEIASIRTHISVMNRKFREATGKNLFLSFEKIGYVISTPESAKMLNIN